MKNTALLDWGGTGGELYGWALGSERGGLIFFVGLRAFKWKGPRPSPTRNRNKRIQRNLVISNEEVLKSAMGRGNKKGRNIVVIPAKGWGQFGKNDDGWMDVPARGLQ